jgi:hypothetical protein
MAPPGELCLLYLDPGAGSLVVQGLIALAAGTAVTVRLYWKRMKRLVFRAPPDERAEGETSSPPGDG